MTSGVKQALPQMLMPGAGVEGKAGRGRMQQGDFAEALGLGKVARQAKSQAGPQEPAIRAPAWPPLASRLDNAIESAREAPHDDAAPNLSSKAASKDEEPSNRPAARTDSNVADTPLPVYLRNTDPLPPAPAPAGPPSPAAQRSAQGAGQIIVDILDGMEPPANASKSQALPAAKEPAGPDRALFPSPNIAEADAAPAPSFTPLGSGERTGPARFEPALKSAAAEELSADRSAETTPEASAEPVRTTTRVSVLAQQNIPAPTPSTALVLAQSIAASDLLGASATRLSLEAIHASATHGSAQSLKIQLHPAELGMVTATLRFAGEQLSIELQVENQEAHRRLAGDSETIVRALRDLGYAVDNVTVLQPSIASTPAARADTAASMTSTQGRSADAFNSGAGSGGGAGSGERSSREDGNTGHSGQHNGAPRKQDSGSGLYI